MDYVRDGEILGCSLVFFKLTALVFYHAGHSPYKSKKLRNSSGIQTYQILTNEDEVCIPSLSSILLAVWVLSIYFAPAFFLQY